MKRARYDCRFVDLEAGVGNSDEEEEGDMDTGTIAQIVGAQNLPNAALARGVH
jgi:hypothetical protein